MAQDWLPAHAVRLQLVFILNLACNGLAKFTLDSLLFIPPVVRIRHQRSQRLLVYHTADPRSL